MHNVTPPALDDERLFDDIVDAKRDPTKARLRSVRSSVLQAYQAYRAAAPEVERVLGATLSREEREALIHAYEVSTRPMRDLRAKLLDRADAARCPFCGISQSATLDHYLPKEDHPTFSVYSRNLVPCCGQCNTLKDRLVVDRLTKVRGFLHPYFDAIPAERYLRLKITITRTAIALNYRIEPPVGLLPQRTCLQIENHFRLLGLADRYRLMSLDELSGKHGSLLRIYGTGKDASLVKEMLADESESFAAVYGVNHWRAVLYAALAEDDQFCDGGFKVIGQSG